MIIQMDWSVLHWFQDHRTKFLDTFMPIITRLGNAGIVWFGIIFFMFFVPRMRMSAVSGFLAIAIDAALCNLIVKPLVDRPRPFSVKDITELLIHAPKDPSFPSGHTSASFAVTFALFFTGSGFWIPCLVLAILIGVSRMYLYVHYFTDVLIGAMIGIVCGAVGSALAVPVYMMLLAAK
ncbi:MAG: phosphatase PAP2 family protein [Eubacterium sp.]|nr:phosphatase PAP2 family protein [Eubacterium sp.]